MQERKRKDRRFRTKDDKNQDERIVCYGCKKPGHFKSECLDEVEEKEEKEKKKKFSKKKKSLMSTWEDLDSSSSDSDEEAHICFMADEAEGSMSDDSNNEVDFTDIGSLRLAYQEAISNTTIITSGYKIMKGNYKNSYKEIELMQQEKASLNDIYLKTQSFSKKKKDCVIRIGTLKETLQFRTQISKTWKKIVLIR